MTITINQLDSGIALRIDNNLYLVLEYHHVKPGKGSAFARVKLKNIRTDAVLERTFRTADKLEDVPLEERELEYLYNDGETYHFMDHHSYEQVAIPAKEVGADANFLLENLVVTVLGDHGRILKLILPNFITTQITETEPGIRGDSTRSGNKPARIVTGASIQVPLFINIGDWVRIDTRSGQYVERVQKP